VALITESFYDQVMGVRYGGGFFTQRIYSVPHPITGTTNEMCAEYVRGNDPLTGRKLWDEIVEGLTVANPDDQKTGVMEFNREETYGPDTEDNLQELLMDHRYTDFMPVILPTLSRINDMLKGTSHDRDEVMGKMRATGYWPYREYTVEHVAACAVMAGCRPEYMPVCLAIASTQRAAGHTSTHSFGNIVVVNGPIRNYIGINYDVGAFSPYSQANMTIGRFWSMITRTQTEMGWAKLCHMGVTGNAMNMTNTLFGEHEEALPPGWNPFHVQGGFKVTDSTVTAFTGWDISHPDPSFEWSLGEQLPHVVSKQASPSQNTTLLLSPDAILRLWREDGFNSKEEVIEYLKANVGMRNEEYATHYYEIQNFRLTSPEKRQPYLDDPDGLTYWCNPHIVCVGGKTNQFFRMSSARPGQPILIDEWM